MKVLLGATAALVLMAAPALAQTTPALPAQCTFTAAPEIPDGARATNQQMNAARTTLDAWRQTRETELAACNTAARALEAQAQAAAAAHNAARDATNAAITQFATETSEYTARSPTSGRRERGSITN